MEKLSDEAIRKLFAQLGIKPGQEYRLVLTKEVKIEPVTKTLDVSRVMPYPLPSGTCDVCGKAFAQHGYILYFIEPLHIESVRNFVIALMEKLDATKNMPLKLAVEAPSTVLNPKEIVGTILDLLKEQGNVDLANYYIRALTHYTPSEAIRYSIEAGRGSLTQKLFQVERHYEALCREWRSELQIHRQLNDSEKFNLVEFAEKHSEEVESDYFNIQSDFHLITARILAYEKMVQRFTEMPRYGKLKQALRRRAEKPVYPIFGYGYPPSSIGFRRRRPRLP